MPANVNYTSMSLSATLGDSSKTWASTQDILINDESKSCRFSVSASSNTLHVEFTALVALSEWRVMIAPASDSYGPDKGTKAYYMTNVASGATKSVDVSLTSSMFSSGAGKYRVSLYAQSQADGLWDVTHVFMAYDLASKSYVSVIPTDSSDGIAVPLKTDALS